MNKRALRKEYNELDAKLTKFRLEWNRQARKDLDYAKVHHASKGKQKDFPAWWYEDVERWRQLRTILNIQ